MFKAIIQDFKEYREQFQEWLFLKRHLLKLKLATKLADMKQRAFNKQYFVVLMPNHKLIAINNLEVERLKRTRCYSDRQIRSFAQSGVSQEETQKLKRLKMLDSRIDGIKLRALAFYYTPISQNNKMSALQLREGRENYITYAKKFLK